MSNVLAYSSANLSPSNSHEDPNLEGVSTNVKLLLKLIHENRDDDGRQQQRAEGMISILDDMKARIEKSQMPSKKAQFRRCNTELRRATISRERKPQEPMQEENHKLRRELSECMNARKGLQRMFSSLGKEKEIMAGELAHKAQQLSNMEEELNDLKAENQRLSEKIKAHAAQHKDRKEARVTAEVTVALQERNQVLCNQLLRSLEGYRALKRKSKEVQDENATIRSKMVDIAKEVEVGLNHIHDLQQKVKKNKDPTYVEHELLSMERMFRCFEAKAALGGGQPRSLCV